MEKTDRISDETAVRRTGRRWDEWFSLLDAWGASGQSHAEIARHLREQHGVDGWWAQSLTVGYERARGRRGKHEHRDGYAVGASKTVGVDVERVFEVFADDAERARLLRGVALTLRTAQPGRSARFDKGGGAERVHIYLTSKGPGKSVVTVQHERLPDAGSAERAKSEWRARLAELKSALEA